MLLIYLSPYSPDFNPIEEAFSKIKAHFKRNGVEMRRKMDASRLAGGARRPEDDAIMAIYSALNTVTAEDARGWFKHSGYLL